MVSAYFSPRAGCEAALVAEIGRAHKSIFAQIFSFTSAPIASALIAAAARRVDVRVIADPVSRTEPGGKLDALKAGGVQVLIDSAHHLQHNKSAVFDARRVITGSFNWTFEAEHGNAEDLVVIPDAKLAAQFLTNWGVHAAHSMVL